MEIVRRSSLFGFEGGRMNTHPQKPLSSSANVLTQTDSAPVTASVNCSPKTAGSNSNAVDNSIAPRVAAAAAPVLLATKAFLASEQRVTGIVIVTNSDQTNSAVAAAAVADSIVCTQMIADQPVYPTSKITFLQPSGLRRPVSLKPFASSTLKAKLAETPIRNCSHLNLVTPEGVHIAANYLKSGESIFAHVEYKDVARDVAIGSLSELNAKAEELNALVVIFVSHTKKQDVSWLQNHCRAYVEVGKCEPGPGAQAAVVLTNVSLSHWHAHAIGRVMVEAFLEADGTWVYHAEPVIAERAIMRLAWYMSHKASYMSDKNVPLRDIAKVIGIDVSNVSRGFTQLLIPPKNTVGLAPPNGWLNRWATNYNLELLWPRKKPGQGADAGVITAATKASDAPKADDAARVSGNAPAPDRSHPAIPSDREL